MKYDLPEILYSSELHVMFLKHTNPRRMLVTQRFSMTDKDGNFYYVPVGMNIDGASIPNLLQNIQTSFGPALYGSVPHDFGYRYGYLLMEYAEQEKYSDQQLLIRSVFPKDLQIYVPVFIGADERFFNDFMSRVSIAAEQDFVTAKVDDVVLDAAGWVTWDQYREKGPNFDGNDNLGLPGTDRDGKIKWSGI